MLSEKVNKINNIIKLLGDLKESLLPRNILEMLASEDWPSAIPSCFICDPNNEQEKLNRGKSIIENFIQEDLNGLKLLDFGCGEGHITEASKAYQPDLTIGYDIRKKGSLDWNKDLTIDWKDVQNNGPYDIIIAHDVIDHLENITPHTMLKNLKEVLSSSGKIYLKCHPFMSRHAHHYYHVINKAYIHLILNENEKKTIGLQPIKKLEKSYKNYIFDAGLNIVNELQIKKEIEPFFLDEAIMYRIKSNLKTDKFPRHKIKIQFIEYILNLDIF